MLKSQTFAIDLVLLQSTETQNQWKQLYHNHKMDQW